MHDSQDREEMIRVHTKHSSLAVLLQGECRQTEEWQLLSTKGRPWKTSCTIFILQTVPRKEGDRLRDSPVSSASLRSSLPCRAAALRFGLGATAVLHSHHPTGACVWIVHAEGTCWAVLRVNRSRRASLEQGTCEIKLLSCQSSIQFCQSMIPSRTSAWACPCFSTSSLAGLSSSIRSKQLYWKQDLFPILNHFIWPQFLIGTMYFGAIAPLWFGKCFYWAVCCSANSPESQQVQLERRASTWVRNKRTRSGCNHQNVTINMQKSFSQCCVIDWENNVSDLHSLASCYWYVFYISMPM